MFMAKNLEQFKCLKSLKFNCDFFHGAKDLGETLDGSYKFVQESSIFSYSMFFADGVS